MNILRIVILALLICNIPGIVRFSLQESLGSLLSYSSFGLLILYYFLAKKRKPLWLLILFGISYFTISGLIDIPSEKDYLVDFTKYLIVVVCGAELARDAKPSELLTLHIIGAASVLLHALFFVDAYGRYSGFYTDPNEAGFVCLLAFGFAYAIKKETIRLFFVFLCTFCGILTFSRTFLALWLLLSLILLVHNWRNFKILGLGIAVLALFFSVSYIFELNTFRFGFIENLFSDGVTTTYSEIELGGRTNVWSSYYEDITEAPFAGNGYLSFMGVEDVKPGVHNSYLRVFGEAGILPFLLFLAIYFQIFRKAIQRFKAQPHHLMLVVATTLFMLTNHTFTVNKNIIFITIWLLAMANMPDAEPDTEDLETTDNLTHSP